MTCIGQRFQNGQPPVDAPENFHRTRHPVAAGAAGYANAVHSTVGRGNWRLRTRLRARAPARSHHRASYSLTRCAPAAVRNCPCATARCARKFSANSRASKKPKSAAAVRLTMLALVNRAQARREIAAPATEVENRIPPPPETKTEIVKPAAETPAENKIPVAKSAEPEISERPKVEATVAPPREFSHPEENLLD